MCLFLIKFAPECKSDLVPIYMSGTGNIFPEEDCSLMMTNANVIFDINALESSNKIDISFSGNYTIYNPSESRNITIAALFSSKFKDMEATCLIKVEHNVTHFTFIQIDWSDPWNQYLDSVGLGMSNRRNFILSNITFPENSSVEIEYKFDTYITQMDSGGQLYIFYDVGTSRAWNGTINERVEFKTYGKLPNSYSKDGETLYNYSCMISNYSNGRSYTWEWIDETIMIDSVYISYNYPYDYWFGRIAPIILFGSVIGGVIIIEIIIQLRKRRKKRLKAEKTDEHSR